MCLWHVFFDLQKTDAPITFLYYPLPGVNGLGTTTLLNTKISKVENKIPDTNDLVTNTVLHTKIGEVENKISVASGLVQKIGYDAKKSNTETKHFTISDYNKFTKEILDITIKENKHYSINPILLLYVLILSCTHFRVNLHSIFA